MMPTVLILMVITAAAVFIAIYSVLAATQATEDAMQSRQTAHADSVETNRLLQELLDKTQGHQVTLAQYLPQPVARDHGVVNVAPDGTAPIWVRQGSEAHARHLKEWA